MDCSIKLKSCPFCGSSDVRMHDHGKVGTYLHQGERVFTVACYMCGASFPGMYEENGRKILLDQWNKRA